MDGNETRLFLKLDKQGLNILHPAVMVEGCQNYLKASIDRGEGWQDVELDISFTNVVTSKAYKFTPVDDSFYIDELPSGTYKVGIAGIKGKYRITAEVKHITIAPVDPYIKELFNNNEEENRLTH